MKLEINMINVENGDAIFLGIKKGNKKALIVIDGGLGKFYDTRVQPRLEQLLEEYDNEIRLMVCTHYDNDHLVGARKILDQYHKRVQEIWIHKIEETLQAEIEATEKSMIRFEESIKESSALKNIESRESKNDIDILESYRELLSFMRQIRDLNMEDKCTEATRGLRLNGFEEFEVISPTSKYYNSMLSELKEEKYIEDMRMNLLENKFVLESSEFQAKSTRDLLNDVNPCDSLETSSRANRVTATNMVSIVTLLTANDKKYLFTGDTGIESFEDNDLLDAKVKNLHWLQLPHHGSKNNTSKKMLKHFNPEVVFVSGNAGPNRPHINLVKCLGTGRTRDEIYVTNQEPDTWYICIDQDGEIWRFVD